MNDNNNELLDVVLNGGGDCSVHTSVYKVRLRPTRVYMTVTTLDPHTFISCQYMAVYTGRIYRLLIQKIATFYSFYYSSPRFPCCQ